jgi:hypothetical protein
VVRGWSAARFPLQRLPAVSLGRAYYSSSPGSRVPTGCIPGQGCYPPSSGCRSRPDVPARAHYPPSPGSRSRPDVPARAHYPPSPGSRPDVPARTRYPPSPGSPIPTGCIPGQGVLLREVVTTSSGKDPAEVLAARQAAPPVGPASPARQHDQPASTPTHQHPTHQHPDPPAPDPPAPRPTSTRPGSSAGSSARQRGSASIAGNPIPATPATRATVTTPQASVSAGAPRRAGWPLPGRPVEGCVRRRVGGLIGSGGLTWWRQ